MLKVMETGSDFHHKLKYHFIFYFRILANRITELEQRLEVVQGGKVAVFPSQWLLDGYMSSEVDKDMQHILDEFDSKNGCSNGKHELVIFSFIFFF